jgi:hypothetical protein
MLTVGAGFSPNPKKYAQFVPSVYQALETFVANMKRFGIPIKAIWSGGTLVCRCIKKGNVLSAHAKGKAIDIYGVMWQDGFAESKVKNTLYLINNWKDPEQRRLLLRIDACLRLSFLTVLDHNYNEDHHDHYHCDMDAKAIYGVSTMGFLIEALEIALNRKIRDRKHFQGSSWKNVSKRTREATYRAWMEFLDSDHEIFRGSDANWERAQRMVFEKIARGDW